MEKERKKQIAAAYKERRNVGGVYSITNTATGERHIFSTADVKGMENRFLFMKSTATCPVLFLRKEWEEYGADAFAFEVLETLEQGETQTPKEFKEDLTALLEIWLEKDSPEKS